MTVMATERVPVEQRIADRRLLLESERELDRQPCCGQCEHVSLEPDAAVGEG